MNIFDFDDEESFFEGPGSQKDDFEEEIKRFKERLKDEGGGSTNIEALEEIVSYYFEKESYQEALHFINLLLDHIPYSSDTWQRKGIILNNLQRHEED